MPLLVYKVTRAGDQAEKIFQTTTLSTFLDYQITESIFDGLCNLLIARYDEVTFATFKL